MRRDTKEMNFESYAERTATLKDPGKERNKKNCTKKAASYYYRNENDQRQESTTC